MTELEKATEFTRRRALASDVRHMSTKREHTVLLSRNGTDLGSKTEITKRGKVVSTLYVLPPIPAQG